MDLFLIKIIALITMVFDHLGVFFFPNSYYLRLIGRISFPLFAWAIANGSIYTKNINKYLLRIFILSIISQIPYQILFTISGNSSPGLNILFTLSLGLVGIILFKKYGNKYIRTFIALLLSASAMLIKCDYGAFGVLSVLIFYLYFKNINKILYSYTLLLLIFFLSPLFINKLTTLSISVSYMNIFELFSVFSIFIVALYNQKIGVRMRYFFYAFYPLHLFVLLFFKLYA